MRSLVWRWRRSVAGVLVPALLAIHPVEAQTPSIHYIYDDLGRLVAVVDPAQGTAIYAYDSTRRRTRPRRWRARPRGRRPPA
jgi:YD repeat-containing protein